MMRSLDICHVQVTNNYSIKIMGKAVRIRHCAATVC